jgi:putative ABC transport system permease protein
MLNPRWHKVIRDLWGAKARTVLVVLSIAVGVFALGTIASARVILTRDLSDGYRAVNPSNAMILTESFDDDLVQAIRSMREVKDAEGRRNLTVRVQVGPDQWKNLQLVALGDFNNIRMDKIRPQGSGVWPPPEHELLVERASLAFINGKVGETIRVELTDGKKRDMRVAGLAHDVNQMPAAFSNLGYGYISLDTLEWLGEPRKFDQLNILVNGDATDKDHNQAVANHVRDKIEKSGRNVLWVQVPEPGKHPVDQIVQALIYLMGALGGLSLVLSGFLVINTISALLTQQVRQIGIMKAIGGQRDQIVGMYLVMVLIFGGLSLLIAVPLGALGSWALTNFMAGMVNFDITSHAIPPSVIAMEVGVGLVVPVLSALIPIITSTRITVREALSQYGLAQNNARQGWVDRLLSGSVLLWGRVSRPLLLSLRNTFRRKSRLALTLLTLTLGGAIFVSIFSVRDSMFLTLDDALKYWNYDVGVNFQHSYRAAQIETEARTIPGVITAEAWGFSGARRLRADDSESKSIILIAPPAATQMLSPVVLQGRWLLSDDENAVVINTDLVKEEKDLKVGDTLRLKIEGRKSDWKVVGLVKGLLAGPFAYINYPYFTVATRDAGKAASVQVQIQPNDLSTQLRVGKALEEHFKSIGMRVSSVDKIAELRAMVQYQFNVIIVLLLVMAVLIGVVGGLGLMGTMSINVLERTREIGVMRAIGASDGAIFRIVLVEGVLIGLMSWAIGAAIALPLSRVLSDTVGKLMLQAPLSFTFSIGGATMWFVIVAVVAALASFLPARSASRLTVREVLAYE